MVIAIEDLKGQLPHLTLRELADMVTTYRGEYPGDAITMAEEELVRRGVTGVTAKGHPNLKLGTRKRWFSTLYPTIVNEQSALQAARQGAGAAWLVAGVTAVLVFLASRVEAIATLGVNGAALLDAAIFVAIGFGIWRGSLAAAILGIVAFVGEHLFMWVNTGRPPGGLALVLLLGFFNGVRGAHALREYRSPKAATRPTALDGS